MNGDRSSEHDTALDLSRRKRATSVSPLGSHVDAFRDRDGAFARLSRHPLARAGGLLLVGIVSCALCADVLASELPVICRWHRSLYILPCMTHPASLQEEDSGSMRASEASGDWLVAPIVEHGPDKPDPSGVTASPPGTSGHPLGTDAFGRDVFARIVHGARTTLEVGAGATAVLIILGVTLGALAGGLGGIVDSIVARAAEALAAIPSVVLAVVVSALAPGSSSTTLFWALALTRWTELARVVRAEVISAEAADDVLSARALRTSPVRVFISHVLPNTIAPVIVAAVFSVASFVGIEAAVDFLRGGSVVVAPSWGEMMGEARTRPDAWWLIAFPAGCMLFVLIALHWIGAAVRSVLDPRLSLQKGEQMTRELTRSLSSRHMDG